MFWLHRHLLAKQVLNSKQSAKGYERIIPEILRRSGYFSTFQWFCVNVNVIFLFLSIVYFDADDSCHELTFNIGQNGIGATAATTRSFSIKVINYTALIRVGGSKFFMGGGYSK